VLRAAGYIAEVVEQSIPGSRHVFKRDFLGCIDILALISGEMALTGIQTTSASNVSSRKAKILAEPKALIWITAGHHLVIHGWAKRGARGKVKRWTLTETRITLADFGEAKEIA
jgi:hypothetical protein